MNEKNIFISSYFFMSNYPLQEIKHFTIFEIVYMQLCETKVRFQKIEIKNEFI